MEERSLVTRLDRIARDETEVSKGPYPSSELLGRIISAFVLEGWTLKKPEAHEQSATTTVPEMPGDWLMAKLKEVPGRPGTVFLSDGMFLFNPHTGEHREDPRFKTDDEAKRQQHPADPAKPATGVMPAGQIDKDAVDQFTPAEIERAPKLDPLQPQKIGEPMVTTSPAPSWARRFDFVLDDCLVCIMQGAPGELWSVGVETKDGSTGQNSGPRYDYFDEAFEAAKLMAEKVGVAA